MSDEQKTIKGTGIVFYDAGDPGTEFELGDNYVERIAPGAMDDILNGSDEMLATFNHNFDALLGRRTAGTLRLTKTPRGIDYEITLNENDPDHVRVYEKQQRGDLRGSSFMFGRTDADELQEGEKTIRQITRFYNVPEMGPVSTPAYLATENREGLSLRFVDGAGHAVPVEGAQAVAARSLFSQPEPDPVDEGDDLQAALRLAEIDAE